MALKILFSIILIIFIVVNCQDMPNKPSYKNPLDTKNPQTNGDPFRLRIDSTAAEVTLIWSEVQLEAVFGYNVYRSIDEPDTFNLLGATVVGDTTWVDTTVVNGFIYWYKVIAVGKTGDESSQTNVAAVRLDTDPIIKINGDAIYTYTTTVILTILAPNAVEMIISNYDDFRDGTWENYKTSKTWLLLDEEGPKTVYIKMKYEDGTESPLFWDTITYDRKASNVVFIPAGVFTMGSESGVGDNDEQPKHTIYLDDYYIDKYEVTNKQYSQFLTDIDDGESYYYHDMKIINNGDGTFDSEPGFEFHPVIYVSYEDAKAYAFWSGGSLPTEAQWEKAARSDELRIYPWGDLLESNQANFWNSGDPFESTISPPTTPVGYYNGVNWNGYQTSDSPSPYGAYDMAGNVWEWCSDFYQADYYSQSQNSNPSGPANGTARVVRGGSWADNPYYLRSACRSHRQPFDVFGNVGFRCVK